MADPGGGSAAAPRVVRQSSGDQVAAHIRRLIFSGALRHGDRIRQNDIAEELGVSRIPVREAIIGLDREGWVRVEPHRGAFVLGLDDDGIRDNFDILGRIYGLSARRAVVRADDEALAEFTRLAAAARATDDLDELFDLTNTFWRHLFRCAASPRLSAIIRVVPALVPDNFFTIGGAAADAGRRGLTAIAKALKARDGDAAAAACIALLERQADNLVALVATRTTSTV
jgi:DNA-binding GntR family transcriptional regulator